MSRAYVLGPISFHGPRYLPVYKAAMRICEKFHDDVIGSYPTFWESDESPSEYYARIRNVIVTADLFVAECGQPSHGVGMELQIACDRDIPLIVLIERERKVSRMILGLPNLRAVIAYDSLADLETALERELEELSRNASAS